MRDARSIKALAHLVRVGLVGKGVRGCDKLCSAALRARIAGEGVRSKSRLGEKLLLSAEEW